MALLKNIFICFILLGIFGSCSQAATPALSVSQDLYNASVSLSVLDSVGQNFTTGSTQINISEIDVGVDTDGTYSITAYLKVYTNRSRTELLHTTNPIYITDQADYAQFVFSTPLTVTPNTNYYFEVVQFIPIIGDHINFSYQNNSNPYASGFMSKNISGVITNYTENDLRFKVYSTRYSPVLYSPTNGSSESKSYPPLTSSINFTWSLDSEYGNNLIIAKDINFNLIAVDITTSNNYSVQSLEAGSYWWKVRYYNSTTETYYSYSNTSNFTLTNTQSITGAGIQGTIYELIGTTQSPLNGATVYIYNNTWSNTQTVGSSGYYLFDGLSNGSVYYVKAVLKDYQNSEIETVNVSGVITRNILMKKTEPTFFEPDKQYVLFKTRWLYCISSCDISGATINVYKSGEVVPYLTGTTDSTGAVSFLLYKTQLYRVTIVKVSDNVNQEETLYPKDTEYIFLITNSPITWRVHTIEQKDAINISVSRNIINSTHTYINVSFNDSLNQTTSLNIGITTNNTSVGTWTGAGNTSQSFIISNYSGNSYLVKLTGTHTTYGSLDETYSVFFEKSTVGITGIPEALWLWFMIGIMFFTAAVFTASLAEVGLIIVCAEGWIGLSLGAFSTINTEQFGIGLTLVSILAILAYIKKQQNKEGMA